MFLMPNLLKLTILARADLSLRVTQIDIYFFE
jgi:hypothetical protein